MLSFKEKVYNAVKTIPQGTIASYGQIALMIGIPRAARQVGWILAKVTDDQQIPWWRIINNKGYISIKNNEYSALEQKKKLENENIKVTDDFQIDMKLYRYTINQQDIEKLEIDTDSLEKLLKII
jgi:methylated-DNA-protein-cysteine methyltransferase-like protein